jgi:hypothetical protein
MGLDAVVVVGLQIPVPEITSIATPTSALVTATTAHNDAYQNYTISLDRRYLPACL